MKNQFNLSINSIFKMHKKTNLTTAIGALCLILFTLTTAQAQVKNNQANTNVSQQQDTFIVKGTVANEFEALAGVKKGDVLIFSHVSSESKKLVIDNENSATNVAINVTMSLDPVVIVGAAASNKVFKSNRNK